MDTGLKGKTALVTGGATSIGLGVAKTLADEGVSLAIASRDPDSDGIRELESRGVDVLPIQADVGKEDQVVKMVETTISRFSRLDLYVNNAAWHWDEPVTKVTTEGWLNTIHTNLSACVWACREIGRHMIERRQGSILIVGSTAMTHPLYKETGYRVSKTGLWAYMEVLALELIPYGIRVNMLVPGGAKTKMTRDFFVSETAETVRREIPMQRFGEPDEYGATAALLLSDKLSPYTMAATVIVDGGWHLRPHGLYTQEELLELNAPEP